MALAWYYKKLMNQYKNKAADCQNKINNYTTTKSSINNLLSKFDTVISDLTTAKTYIDDGVIINCESFDKGKIDQFKSSLTTIKEDCVALISECSSEISSLTSDMNTANSNYTWAYQKYYDELQKERNGE